MAHTVLYSHLSAPKGAFFIVARASRTRMKPAPKFLEACVTVYFCGSKYTVIARFFGGTALPRTGSKPLCATVNAKLPAGSAG